mmetsp:Transcript_11245/g.33757  ORF Transcript_11245/g.33757 Transcript_11245/m.33757 type:complete len:736 (+) Transcript_11245:214-2421(+)
MQPKKRPASGAAQRGPAKRGGVATQKRTIVNSPQAVVITDSEVAAPGSHRGNRRQTPDGEVICLSSDSGASVDMHQSENDSRLPRPPSTDSDEWHDHQAPSVSEEHEHVQILKKMHKAAYAARNEAARLASKDDTPADIPTRVKIQSSPMYQTLARLGKGGYGYVYSGVRVQANRKSYQDKPMNVAIKFEKVGNNNSGMPAEWIMYKALAGCPGLPALHYHGKLKAWHVMIMELSGCSLYDLSTNWPGEPPRNVPGYGALPDRLLAGIAVEALNILENIHARGYVHGDVKPENFVMTQHSRLNSTDDAPRLLLLDLGLAQRFRHPPGSTHANTRCSYRCEPDVFRGTGRYASLHAHLGRAVSPRDDLESLVYTLAFLVSRQLPWQGHKGTDVEKRHKVAVQKSTISAASLCATLPTTPFLIQLEEFAESVFDLTFYAKPDYEAYRSLFDGIIFSDTDQPLLQPSPVLEAPTAPDDGTLPQQQQKRQRLGLNCSQYIIVFDEMRPSGSQTLFTGMASSWCLTTAAAAERGNHCPRITAAVGQPDGLFTVVKSPNPGYWSWQEFNISSEFLNKSFVEECWAKGYVITCIAGLPYQEGSLVVMTAGTDFQRQSYKIANSLPFDWIRRKWSEGFKVTAAACNQGRWCVVMATTSLYTHQVVETDFQYPSEAIHLRWDAGYRITAVASTPDQTAVIMSRTRRDIANQETLRKAVWPTGDLQDRFDRGLAISSISYGRSQH